MNGKIKYTFTAIPWLHTPTGGWCFVSLPDDLSLEIRNLLKAQEEGWGRLKATAQIGSTTWATAIWFDTKKNTYLLPLKATIRKKEGVTVGEMVEVGVWM